MIINPANRLTLSHFLIASERLAAFVDSITRSGVGNAANNGSIKTMFFI